MPSRPAASAWTRSTKRSRSTAPGWTRTMSGRIVSECAQPPRSRRSRSAPSSCASPRCTARPRWTLPLPGSSTATPTRTRRRTSSSPNSDLGLQAGDEVAGELRGLLALLELRDVPAPGQDDRLGRRQRLFDEAAEAGRHQHVLLAPDEQRRWLEGGQPGPVPALADRFVKI